MDQQLRAGSEPVEGYTLIERLGRGGFGEVWKAVGPGGFQVALKFVSLVDDVGPVELRALEIIKGIRHPHLLATFGSWEQDGRLVIAMELAERTLLDRLREAAGQGFPGIPAPEIFEHFLDASKALDFLNEPRHPSGGGDSAGIQHRDVKPQNLLLVGGSVKVADFGLARVMEHSQTGHTGSLTPSYAAPEFFDRKTSAQSDQYSLAVTYCHLRGGRLPFHGNPAEVMAGHMLRDPDLSMLPEAERPAVARALSKAPRERWPSCRAFVQAATAAAGAGPHHVPETRAASITGGLPTTTPMPLEAAPTSAIAPRPGIGTGSDVRTRGKSPRPAVVGLIAAAAGLAFIAVASLLSPRPPAPTSGVRGAVARPLSPPAPPEGPTAARPSNPPAPAQGPTAARTLADRGLTLLAGGDPEAAIVVLDEAIRLDPDNARAFAARSFAHANQREPRHTPFRQVLVDSAAALRIDPKLALAHAARGLALALGPRPDFAAGLAEADEALRIEPRLALAYLARAHNYLRRGRQDPANSAADYRSAEAACTAALRSEPRHHLAYLFRANARVARSDPDGALADCDEAIRINPKNGQVYSLKGSIWLGKAQPDRAITDCTRALRLDPTLVNTFKIRAGAYRAKGEEDRASADDREADRLIADFRESNFATKGALKSGRPPR